MAGNYQNGFELTIFETASKSVFPLIHMLLRPPSTQTPWSFRILLVFLLGYQKLFLRTQVTQNIKQARAHLHARARTHTHSFEFLTPSTHSSVPPKVAVGSLKVYQNFLVGSPQTPHYLASKKSTHPPAQTQLLSSALRTEAPNKEHGA